MHFWKKSSVQLEDIRPDISFKDIPIFALRCIVHNIRVPDSGNQLGGAKAPWPLGTISILRSMIVEKQVGVVIKNDRDPFQVDLRSSDQGIISDELVKQGLAEFVETKLTKSQRKKKNKNRK